MSNAKQSASYGTWASPIRAKDVANAAVSFQQLVVDGDDVFWVESRPKEGGRCVVVRWRAGDSEDVTPNGFSARSLVYSYGGGAIVVSDGVLCFSNYSTIEPLTNDQRLYRQRHDERPVALTAAVNIRYGDGVIDAARGRVLCVAEDFTEAGLVDGEPAVSIVAVDLEGARLTESIVSGNDYYSSPVLSPDGSHLAWLTWKKPSMPWDCSQLFVASLDADGRPRAPTRVSAVGDADGTRCESIFQPQWSPDGQYLYFVSDQDNWWSIYRYSLSTRGTERVAPASRRPRRVNSACHNGTWECRRTLSCRTTNSSPPTRTEAPGPWPQSISLTTASSSSHASRSHSLGAIPRPS